MKEIKILHLFPKLLSLYGEYGNIVVLRHALEEAGCQVTVQNYENGKLDVNGYHFIYAGAGTEDNLLEAIRRLMPHKETILASIRSGAMWMATGNAMTLFGQSVEYRGNTTEALGCFDYTTQIKHDQRYLGDVMTNDYAGTPLVGFVNTSCVYTQIQNPLWTLQMNPKLGNDKQNAGDGIFWENFYGTQLIGPILAKNPHFLQHICRELTEEPICLPADSNAQKAFDVALAELKKRME